MRENVRQFVRLTSSAFHLRGPVYEFGAYQVPEQSHLGDLRDFFPGTRYIGCDLRRGPGVDRIEDVTRLSLPDESVPTIVCVETLEHVFEVRRAVDEMLRVLAPGGAILISVPLDFRVHGYPDDFWRLTPACMTQLLAPLGASIVASQGLEKYPHSVFGVGFKAPVPTTFFRDAHRFATSFDAWLASARAAQPGRRRWKQRLLGWMRSKGERRRHRDYHTARYSFQLSAGTELLPALFLDHDAPQSASAGAARLDLR